jgi:hypothetical protein
LGKTVVKRRVTDLAEQSGGRIKLLWLECFNMGRVHSGSIASFLLRKFDQVVPTWCRREEIVGASDAI